ncbi:EAL domain-containing protein [Azospira restricta]|uniref:EAL domain-containing protein n=1 Tax=Azospira restricta TaxID=404405 RepID=A0A974Y3Q4_9RHOO|nr:EAL domain-containing protein [Azospira restricta]QRJ64005.1 EAL domain-containing protein [Azospira restricta]
MTPRACCIEPNGELRSKLVALLHDTGWVAETFDDLPTPDCPLAQDAPAFDLIVATGNPQQGSLLDLVARIRSHSASETTPIVVLGNEDDAVTAEQAFVAGVTEVFSWQHLADFRTYLGSFADDESADIAGRRVLILEDDRIQGFLLQSILAKEGLAPMLFNSVESALAGADAADFDVVITDLVLGLGQSGVSFIRRLRQSQCRSANAPIIAVSGFDDDARRLDALRAGAESFLPKPVAPAELFFHLRRLVGRPPSPERTPPPHAGSALDIQALGKLTEREQLICALAVAGHRDKRIAQELGISYWTVRTHLARIFRKFHVSNRVGLAAATRAANADEEAGSRGSSVDAPAARAGWQTLSDCIMERIPLGVVVTDHVSRIVHVNRAYCEISGYKRDELLGRTPRLLRSDRHPPEFHRKLLTTLSTAGRWSGSVWNRSKSGRDYLGKLDIRRLPGGLPLEAAFVGVMCDITEENAHVERVREQSLQDPLTGLANRILLRDRTQYEIARARRTGGHLALAFFDLDNFKPINDQYGHAVGDGVLQEVAARLAARLREHDTLARIGGDEFVALLTDIEHKEVARSLCQRLAEAFAIPFGPRGIYGRVGTSIGISLYPEDGREFETLIMRADSAMYRAKQAGGNRIACFDPSAGHPGEGEAGDRERLDAALDNHEFELLFQPQLELASGRIVAAEALLRWRNPQYGLLAAAHFIPIAERSGSIAKLGGWALRQACRALKRLARAGHPQLRLSVNVSPQQILRGQAFADDALAAIADHDLAPGRLELEISESVFLHNPEQAVKTLGTLAERGVSLALDGIGKDYFSPAYLRHLPFRAIKIDRQCIGDALSDPYCDSVARSSLLLAQGLGLEAIAEGVETDAQLAFLDQAGYRHAQGNLLGSPMPLADLIRRLDDRHG